MRTVDRTLDPAPGPGPVTPRRRLVSRALAPVAVVLLVGTVVISIGDPTSSAGDVPFFLSILGGVAGLAVIGAILAARAPGNPIGPLYQVAGASMSVAVFSSEYITRGTTDLPDLPALGVAGWFGQFAFIPAFAAIITAFLLFPDGRPPTQRWRPLLWVIWGGAVLSAIGTTFGVPTFQSDAGIDVANPFVTGPSSLLSTVNLVGGSAMALAGVLAVVSVVVRFRRSEGDERLQLRWLAWACVLILVSVVAVFVTGIGLADHQSTPANDVAFFALVSSVLVGLPLATALAVLRYRLYDLDIVVKKTAIYSIVAIVLTALYLALLAVAALAGLGGVPAAVVFVISFTAARRRARKLADRIVYGKRATPFEVLSEFSERVGETYSIDDVLPRMTQLLAAGTGAREARTWIRQGRTLRSASVAPVEAGLVPDVELAGDELPAFAEDVHVFPVVHQGELLGAITLAMAANDPMDATKERLAQGVASQAGLALRNVRLVEDLRASRRRIVAAQDERAKALERNIHDGAQQQLVALTVRLRIAEQLAERDPSAVGQTLRDLQSQAADALEDLRDLARGIYPPLLADKGLAAALEAQARKAALPVSLDAEDIGRYPQEIESTVYFCVLEALNNVAKYAEAGTATVFLSRTGGILAFEVRDDGVGFDAGATSYGTGLQGMADRLDAVGGNLTVRSDPGAGAVVHGEIPVGVTLAAPITDG